MRSIAILVLVVAACGDHGDGHTGADTAPAAPTNLAVSSVSGGAHLTWTDNADNEDHYMVMRMPLGGTYDDIDTLAFNSTQYHDSGVTAGMTYVYKVVAMNAKGESSSNEVMFTP
jgi:hypothetical protein